MTVYPFCIVALIALGCGSDAARQETVLRTTSWADPSEAAIDALVLREFERRHPGVRVIAEPITNQAEYREKVLTSIAAGAPPDVFLLDGIDVPAIVGQGVVLDLSRFAPRVGVSLDAFYPSVLQMFARGERVYAFPKGFSPIVIFYNRRLFDRARIPHPADGWTHDEFLRAARSLTLDTDRDGEVDQWGYALDRRFFAWQPWVWSGGGDILSPDGSRASDFLNSPATDSVISFLTSLPTSQGVAPRPNAFRAVSGSEVRLFYSGRVAMLTSGHWLIPQLRRYLDSDRLEVGVVSIPSVGQGKQRTVIFASGYAVPANTPHRKLAVELAAFMAGSYAQKVRLERGLELASIRHVQEEFAMHDPYGLEDDFARQVPFGSPPWGTRIERFREIEAQMFDVLDRVLIGGERVHAVTTDVARRIDGILTR
ncbi:MAG: sugar ABC transporter substrate-binding protein [Gemmatimonadaceae bacterium]